MALEDVSLPKDYKDGRLLFERNLDRWRQATEEGFRKSNLNLAQIAKDCFPSSYSYNNNGSKTLTISLQEQISSFVSGSTPIAGTTSDSFTINSDGKSAILTTSGLSANRTFTFPDVSGKLAVLQSANTYTLDPTTTLFTLSSVTTTGDGLRVEASSLTTGSVASFYSASTNAASSRYLVEIENNSASASRAGCLSIIQNGGSISGSVIDIIQTGTGPTISINSGTTTNYSLSISAGALTTGSLAFLSSDSDNVSARNLIWINQASTLATGTVALFVNQDANQIALSIDAENTTTNTLDIRSDVLTNGSIARFYSNSADASGRNLVYILNDNAAASGAVGLFIRQDAATNCIVLDQDGEAAAIYIDTEGTTTNVIDVESNTITTGNIFNVDNANALTTGKIAYFYSNSASASARNLVEIHNDNSAAAGTICLEIEQDSNFPALNVVSQSTTDTQGVIRLNAASITSGIGLMVLSDSVTTGSLARFYSNSSSNSGRSLVEIINDHSSADAAVCLSIDQDGDAAALSVLAIGIGLDVTTSSTSNSAYYGLGFNGSYASDVYYAASTRAANAAYSFFRGDSNNGGDTEILLRGDGQVFGDGGAYNTPADYAEYFESEDSQGIAPGFFVTYAQAQGRLIKIASPGDDVLGIISANPAVVGDTAWSSWSNKYLKDEFNKRLLDENGDRIINHKFDPKNEYIPRSDRPEWVAVGMLGKLNVRTSEDIVGSYVSVGANGYAVNGTHYRVIEVIRQKSNDPEQKGYGVVRVVFK